MTTVYVAASSQDLERAKRWTRVLECGGFRVASTWVDVVEALGEANPRNASEVTRRKIAETCVSEVMEADILWVLLPPLRKPSCGAWVELGVAYASGRTIIASGDSAECSVFAALGREFESDAEAFAEIVRLDAAEEYGPSAPESWG